MCDIILRKKGTKTSNDGGFKGKGGTYGTL